MHAAFKPRTTIMLREQAATAAPPPAAVKAARAHLDHILQTREFVHVHQPGLVATLWNRLLRWLFHALSAAGGTSGGQWLGRAFWIALLALGVGGLLWWFSRQLRRQGLAPRDPAPARSAPAAQLEWEAWWSAAEAHAARGDWRDAVHSAYWAAASRLAQELRWPPNPARTPRESLRLLDPNSSRRDPFAQLTRSFERTWYGHRAAAREDFDRARDLFLRLDAR
jgi:hypothetical protein